MENYFEEENISENESEIEELLNFEPQFLIMQREKLEKNKIIKKNLKNIDNNQRIGKINLKCENFFKKDSDSENSVDQHSSPNLHYEESEREIEINSDNLDILINSDNKINSQTLNQKIIALNSLTEKKEIIFDEKEKKQNIKQDGISFGEKKLFETYE